jgi:hypothetical protein
MGPTDGAGAAAGRLPAFCLRKQRLFCVDIKGSVDHLSSVDLPDRPSTD